MTFKNCKLVLFNKHSFRVLKGFNSDVKQNVSPLQPIKDTKIIVDILNVFVNHSEKQNNVQLIVHSLTLLTEHSSHLHLLEKSWRKNNFLDFVLPLLCPICLLSILFLFIFLFSLFLYSTSLWPMSVISLHASFLPC